MNKSKISKKFEKMRQSQSTYGHNNPEVLKAQQELKGALATKDTKDRINYAALKTAQILSLSGIVSGIGYMVYKIVPPLIEFIEKRGELLEKMADGELMP